MVIVLSLYALVVWLIFFKFKLLPWNRIWKSVVYSIAGAVALFVVGALQYYTPVSSTAVVQSPTQKISSVVSGQVESVLVSESQQVLAGDVLFRIDPLPYQYALDERKAALEIAKIRLDTTVVLVEKDFAPAKDIDLYTSELDQAQARYDAAVFELKNTVAVAPADGVVSLVALFEGEVVATTVPLLNFVRSDDRWIAAAFKQNGLENIEPDTAATVVFSAAPGEIFDTSVVRVAPVSVQGQVTAQNTASPIDAIFSGTQLYPVRVRFPADAPSNLHRTGGEATVTVFTDDGNPINVLARILQWVGTWMAFVF
jgi:multidrug resistance efflux pump